MQTIGHCAEAGLVFPPVSQWTNEMRDFGAFRWSIHKMDENEAPVPSAGCLQPCRATALR